MASSDDYQERFKDLQALEDRKDDLINDLLARVDDLKGQRDEAKSDLETEREARRRLQRSLRDSVPSRTRFVLLILHLDADTFLFDDQWMRRDPASGGEKIAGEIVEKVREFIKKDSLVDESAHVQVIVKVYGDLFKLWRTYEAAGSNLGSSDLTRFFSHFNRKDSLVDFVDFGPRRGSIEKKLSGILAHYLLDDRVEQILFASPHTTIPPILAPLDAHLSSPLNTSSDHRSRLTLLTAPPVPKDWDDLGYRTTSHFDPLFTVPPILAPAPQIPPRSSSHTPAPRVRSPPARFKPKEHHKSPPPAPIPPPANVPRTRTRKDTHEAAWARDDRSPPRQVGFEQVGYPNPFAVGRVMGRGQMQMARRDTFPVQGMRYHGVPPEAPSVPEMRWS